MTLLNKQDYENGDYWGLSTHIDLFKCDSKLIRDAVAIKLYLKELIYLINMRAYGIPTIVNFGEDDEVAGYSMTQLIETSLISGHFSNKYNNAYIDIFSCKWYDVKVAMEFTMNYFKAEGSRINVIGRLKKDFDEEGFEECKL